MSDMKRKALIITIMLSALGLTLSGAFASDSDRPRGSGQKTTVITIEQPRKDADAGRQTGRDAQRKKNQEESSRTAGQNQPSSDSGGDGKSQPIMLY